MLTGGFLLHLGKSLEKYNRNNKSNRNYNDNKLKENVWKEILNVIGINGIAITNFPLLHPPDIK